MPQHDVGAVVLGHGDHALQSLRPQIVVGVQEEDELTLGEVESDVTGRRGATGVLLVHDSHQPWMRLGQPFELSGRPVGGAIVDRDDLQRVLVDGLFGHGSDAAR